MNAHSARYGRVTDVFRASVFAVAYFLCAVLGLLFRSEPESLA